MAYPLLCQEAEAGADVLKDVDLEGSEMIQLARASCACTYIPSTHTENEAWWHMSVILALGRQREEGPRSSLARLSC